MDTIHYYEGLIRLNAWIPKLFSLKGNMDQICSSICEDACAVADADICIVQVTPSGVIPVCNTTFHRELGLQPPFPGQIITVYQNAGGERGDVLRWSGFPEAFATIPVVPEEIAGTMVAPLLEGERVMGAVAVLRVSSAFSRREERLFKLVSQLLPHFLNNAVTREELSRHAVELEHALRSNEHQFRSLIENSPDWIWIMSKEARFIYSSLKGQELLGYGSDELLGKPIYQFLANDNRESVRVKLSQTSATRTEVSNFPMVFEHKDHYRVTLDSSVSLYWGENHELQGFFGINHLTPNIAATEALKEHLAFFQTVIDAIPFPLYYKDGAGRYQGCNSAFEQSFGVQRQELIGKTFYDDATEISGACREFELTLEAISLGGPAEMALRFADGSVHDVMYSKTELRKKESGVDGIAAVIVDLTEQKRAEEGMRLMSYYDPLTGLPNRYLFKELLVKAQAQAVRSDRLLAVLFLNLDRFKIINDTLGHAVGDLLLQGVAHRLKETCRRETDTVARRGSDEFLILLADIEEIEDVIRLSQSILENIARPFIVTGRELFLSTSIGISIFPFDGNEVETLMQKADVAMSRAKEQGKSTYRLYTESMNEKAHERLALENDLRRALERDELELYYQPKVDTDSGRIGSCEALARWNHPQLGFIGPSRFIPIAEETGLIVPLGEWVLRQACIQNLEWQKKGMSPLRVAVNLSPRQFLQHDLLDMIARVLKNVGMSPQCLELEVTENVMIQNIAQTAAILRRLHDLGIQISIDDFGTGYSSLSYLKRFPIHALKIDRSFVSDITWNQDDAAIASAVITMAHSLKLGVIAEGVETKEQLKFLQDLQCHNMQGNFFSKPVPANEFYGLLKEGQAPVMM